MESSDSRADEAVQVPFANTRPDHWPEYREHSLFWSAVLEAESALQVPREMAMMSALGAMSVACQGWIDVQYPTGNCVQTPLMLLTLAESGERKTTVQNRFFAAITTLNRKAAEVADERLDHYMDEQALWKQEVRAWEGTYRKAIKNGDDATSQKAKETLQQLRKKQPAFPQRPRLLYDDTTPQALVQLLNDYSPHGCLLTSEANSVFSGRALQELDKLNTLWDGGDVIVDRMTRPSFILSGARLTMALMTQPSVINRFLSKRGEEARGMGFLARFLVVKPEEKAGTRQTRPLGPLPHLDEFNRRVEALLTDSTTDTPHPDDRTKNKKVVQFSAMASSQWEKYHQGIEDAMQENQPYFYYKDHASKLMENITRMAAILHHFEGGDDEISYDTLKFCYEFVLKCSQHFQRYLAGEPQVVSDANELAKTLLEWADKGNQQPYLSSPELPSHLARGRQWTFTMTNLKQYGPYRLRGRENDQRLREAVKLLQKMGHVKMDRHKQYTMRENIFAGPDQPALRNGVEYRVEALPFFDEQQYYQDPHARGVVNASGYYLIKPE
ncbi:YfjI family protein [Modicisalibacter zincidurans]|uniref:YfjI family protein n=1 Tax=Modicisalibacter zincidurans TaxID=1178777 RepID=A0ABP9QZS5_9GAMM|nr:YfjI family protein [Halomonas zincidurans]